MITRQDIIKTLEHLMSEKNADVVQELITKVNGLNDEELSESLKQKRIKKTRDIKKIVDKQVKASLKFTRINDLVSYGVTGKTIHIHLIPKDVRSMFSEEGKKQGELELISALESIQQLLKTDKRLEKIKNISAVSPIIRKTISQIFANLDFDVRGMKMEDAKKDKEFKKFYKTFKDKRYLGRASLTKEKLFSEAWNKVKNDRKDLLEGPKQDDFAKKLNTLTEPEDGSTYISKQKMPTKNIEEPY